MIEPGLARTPFTPSKMCINNFYHYTMAHPQPHPQPHPRPHLQPYRQTHQQPHKQPHPRPHLQPPPPHKQRNKGQKKNAEIRLSSEECGQKERYEALVGEILKRLEREDWVQGGQIARAKLPEDIFYFFGSVFHQIKLKSKVSRSQFLRLCQKEYNSVSNEDISQLLAAREVKKPYQPSHCNPQQPSPFTLLPSIQQSKFSQFLQANIAKRDGGTRQEVRRQEVRRQEVRRQEVRRQEVRRQEVRRQERQEQKEPRRQELRARRATEQAGQERDRIRQLSVKVSRQLRTNAIRLADYSRVIQQLM